jgi:hypothetical protein
MIWPLRSLGRMQSGLTPLRSPRLVPRGPSPVRSAEPAAAAPPSAPTDDKRLATAKRQAAFILRSAAKARGEVVDESEPLDPTAAAILAAGRKRRNEHD